MRKESEIQFCNLNYNIKFNQKILEYRKFLVKIKIFEELFDTNLETPSNMWGFQGPTRLELVEYLRNRSIDRKVLYPLKRV